MVTENEEESGVDFLSQVEQEIVKEKLAEKDALREASGLVSDKAKAAAGVLKSLVTVGESKDQILAMASYGSIEEADNISAALREAARYGIDDTPIYKFIINRTAVASKQMSKTEWGVMGLTHLEINQADRHKFNWRGKPKEEKPQ